MTNTRKEVYVVIGVVAVAELVNGHLHLEIDTATIHDALIDKCRDGEIEEIDLAIARSCLDTLDWSVRLG